MEIMYLNSKTAVVNLKDTFPTASKICNVAGTLPFPVNSYQLYSLKDNASTLIFKQATGVKMQSPMTSLKDFAWSPEEGKKTFTGLTRDPGKKKEHDPSPVSSFTNPSPLNILLTLDRISEYMKDDNVISKLGGEITSEMIEDIKQKVTDIEDKYNQVIQNQVLSTIMGELAPYHKQVEEWWSKVQHALVEEVPMTGDDAPATMLFK